MSGLPNARSMTSSPARRSCIFNASICANAYGGRALIRRNSMTINGTSRVGGAPASFPCRCPDLPKAVLLDVGGVFFVPDARPHPRRVRACRAHSRRSTSSIARTTPAPRARSRRRRPSSTGRRVARVPRRRTSPSAASPDELRDEVARASRQRVRRRRAVDARAARRARRTARARGRPACGSASSRTPTASIGQRLAEREHPAGRPGHRRRGRVRHRLGRGRRR